MLQANEIKLTCDGEHQWHTLTGCAGEYTISSQYLLLKDVEAHLYYCVFKPIYFCDLQEIFKKNKIAMKIWYNRVKMPEGYHVN